MLPEMLPEEKEPLHDRILDSRLMESILGWLTIAALVIFVPLLGLVMLVLIIGVVEFLFGLV